MANITLSPSHGDRDTADRTTARDEPLQTQDANCFVPIPIPAPEQVASDNTDEADDAAPVQRHLLAEINPIDPDTGDEWPDFWLSHPVLTRVFVTAERRNIAPMALLVAMLTVAGAAADYRWRILLDDTPSPLTLFTALISPSGSGKSKAVSAALSLINLDPERCRCIQPAHLAGLIDSMGELVEVETDQQTKKGETIMAKEWQQTRHSALVMMDELQRLETLAKRFDDDLLPGLRTGWSGGALETTNVKAGGRFRSLAAGSFALSMLASGTPESVGPWLKRVESVGDGDRTLIASAMDGARIRRQTEEHLAEHEQPEVDDTWTLVPPVPEERSRRMWPVDVDPTVADLVRTANRDRNRGVRPQQAEWLGESGHLELVRLRAAACWSLLRHQAPAQMGLTDDVLLETLPHPLTVTGDDWRIAGAVIAWDHSTTLVLEEMQMIESAEARRRKAEAKASEAVVSDTRVEQAQTRRLLERAVSQVVKRIEAEDTPLLPSECNQALSGRLRRKWAEMGHGRLIDEVLSDRRFDRVEDGKVALRTGDDAHG